MTAGPVWEATKGTLILVDALTFWGVFNAGHRRVRVRVRRRVIQRRTIAHRGARQRSAMTRPALSVTSAEHSGPTESSHA